MDPPGGGGVGGRREERARKAEGAASHDVSGVVFRCFHRKKANSLFHSLGHHFFLHRATGENFLSIFPKGKKQLNERNAERGARSFQVSLKEKLKIERYKLVTDRQKYFTGLALSAFDSYLKIFLAVIAGGVALVSAKSLLDINM